MGAYAPTTGKDISKSKKIPNKNLARISRHFMCTHQGSWKTDIFYVLCKKNKNVSCCATPILAPKFVFFTHHTKNAVFS
jgi:hypothetical protein